MQPFQEPPELAPDSQVLYCYRDATRPCTAECVAFLVHPEYHEPWGQCVQLVASYRSAKHLVVLAQDAVARSKECQARAVMEIPR